MKRIGMILLCFISLFFIGEEAFAQQRTKIADGYYLVSYGNVQVIEDDNREMSIQVKVEKAEKNDYGEQLYNVLCKNQTIKAIGGLKQAITRALNAAGVPIPGWVVGPAVTYIYQKVCDYYGEK